MIDITYFFDEINKNLDKDLVDMVHSNNVLISDAVSLQILRLLRKQECVFVSPLSNEGWTDGLKWYPSEPGTFTTGENHASNL